MRTDLLPMAALGLVCLAASVLFSPIAMLVLAALVFVIGYCTVSPQLERIGVVMGVVAAAVLVLTVVGVLAFLAGISLSTAGAARMAIPSPFGAQRRAGADDLRYACIVLLALVISLASSMALAASDQSDAYAYGSGSVGAKDVTFDPDGGSGGYTQKVLSGNRFYFPTEHQTAGLTSSEYEPIRKEGHVLSGWMGEDGGIHAPGSLSLPVTSDVTYIAVWESAMYGSDGRYENPCCEVQRGSPLSYSTESSDGTGPGGHDSVYWAFLTAYDQGSSEILGISVTGPNGYSVSKSRVSLYTDRPDNLIGEGLRVGYFTVKFAWDGCVVEVSGSPPDAGLYRLRFTAGDVEGTLFVSVVDPETDPSNLYHASYGQNGYDYDRFGPYGTAVDLPGGSDRIERLKGWSIRVDGSDVVFPLGGSYTLVKKVVVLQPARYEYSEVQGCVGIVAFNAMGGTYSGALAVKVDRKGYVPLMPDGEVSKDGHVLIGWNLTGSVADTVYPAGYLFDAVGEYTELKAVWAGSADMADVTFSHPSLSPQSAFRMAEGYEYAVPVHGFDVPGYALSGWSAARHEVGDGTAEIHGKVEVSGGATYYSVYRPEERTFTIIYSPNGAPGAGVVREYTSTTGVATLEPCPFAYEGHAFAGWSESAHSESAQYAPGYQYGFGSDPEVTMYAVWTEDSGSEDKLFTIVFLATGADYNPMVPLAWAGKDGSHTFVVPSVQPERRGFDFVGWSSDPSAAYSMPEYSAGKAVTLELGEGESSETLTLYAVWSQPHGGGEGSYTVTFKKGSTTVYETSVGDCGRVSWIDVSSDDGEALAGWFTDSGRRWDFSADAVTSDLVLKARFVRLFHLEVGEDWVKVVLDRACKDLSITYPDGKTEREVARHDIPEGSEGMVSVTGTLEDYGTVTAIHRYKALDKDDAVGGDGVDAALYLIAGTAACAVALLVAARRYL